MENRAEKASEKAKNKDELIAGEAARAALETEGVTELAGGLTDVILRSILGKDLLSKGIKVSAEKDGTWQVDAFVIVAYGVNIPVAAWDLQSNIKRRVEKNTGVRVGKVNIHVQGVHIPEQEE